MIFRPTINTGQAGAKPAGCIQTPIDDFNDDKVEH